MDLPHDWSIHFDCNHESPTQNEGGQLNGGRRMLGIVNSEVDEKDLDKNVRLTFDGVYSSQVFVSGPWSGVSNKLQPISYDSTKYLHKDGRKM